MVPSVFLSCKLALHFIISERLTVAPEFLYCTPRTPAASMTLNFEFDQSEQQAAVLQTRDVSWETQWNRGHVWRWASSRWGKWRNWVKYHAAELHRPHHDEIFLVYGETRTTDWHKTVLVSEGSRDTSVSLNVSLQQIAQVGGGWAVHTQDSDFHETNWGPQPTTVMSPNNFRPTGDHEVQINDDIEAQSQSAMMYFSPDRDLAPVRASSVLLFGNLRAGQRTLNQTVFVKRIIYQEWKHALDGRLLEDAKAIVRYWQRTGQRFRGLFRRGNSDLGLMTDSNDASNSVSVPSKRRAETDAVVDPLGKATYEPLSIIIVYMAEVSFPIYDLRPIIVSCNAQSYDPVHASEYEGCYGDG